MTSLPNVLSPIKSLLGKPVFVDIKKSGLWGHEAPATLPVWLFDYSKEKSFVKKMIFDYADYLENLGFTKKSEWIKAEIIPFAIVAAENTSFAKIKSEYHAVLFFDLKKGNGANCPILITSTDSWKLKKVATNFKELGIHLKSKTAASKADKEEKPSGKNSPIKKASKALATKLYDQIIRNGDVSAIKDLVKQKIDINLAVDSDDRNLLMCACAEKGRADVAKALIAAGADVNAYNKSGTTALHGAAFGENKDCVKILIEAGADVNRKDKYHQTALLKHIVYTSNPNPAIVSMLAKAGSDLTVKFEGKAIPALAKELGPKIYKALGV